eukprot:565943-Prorocentrum_minimum.AAC.1
MRTLALVPLESITRAPRQGVRTRVSLRLDLTSNVADSTKLPRGDQAASDPLLTPSCRLILQSYQGVIKPLRMLWSALKRDISTCSQVRAVSSTPSRPP